MKKVALFVIFALMSIGVSAQGQLRGGAHLGLPIGDAGDISTFSIAIDLGYLFEISDQFSAGPTAGFSHSFGDDISSGSFTIEVDDIQFLPIGAAGRFNATEELWFGLDLGYAIGINDGNDGGFYYSPRAAYGVSDAIDIVLALRGVSRNGGSFDILSLGVAFNL